MQSPNLIQNNKCNNVVLVIQVMHHPIMISMSLPFIYVLTTKFPNLKLHAIHFHVFLLTLTEFVLLLPLLLMYPQQTLSQHPPPWLKLELPSTSSPCQCQHPAALKRGGCCLTGSSFSQNSSATASFSFKISCPLHWIYNNSDQLLELELKPTSS